MGQYTIDTPQRSNMSIINIHKSDEISPIIHHTNLMFVHPGKKNVHLYVYLLLLWVLASCLGPSCEQGCQGRSLFQFPSAPIRDPGIPWPNLTHPNPITEMMRQGFNDFAREPVVAAMVRIVRGRRHGQRGDQRPQLRWSWAKKLRCHGTMSQEKETKLDGSEFHHSNIFQKFLVFFLHAETNC